MKQAEFQTAIAWEPDMEYCSVDCQGIMEQHKVKPTRYITPENDVFYCSSGIQYIGFVGYVPDPENWLFKRSGEMEEQR